LELDVSESTRLKTDWVLTGDALQDLLEWLDSDPASAGEKYEQIRASLIKFFESRGCLSPEEQTDETIDRVARRLSEGVVIHTTNPFLYFYGIALRVLQEYWRRPPVFQTAVPIENAIEQESRLDCMEDCLQKLPRDIVELLTEYCGGNREQRGDRRREMAEQLGISLNTLRIKVHRVRERLGSCLTRCIERKQRTRL
jgi:DNA-directed RNA polymerase specialized sigma24 family protein